VRQLIYIDRQESKVKRRIIPGSIFLLVFFLLALAACAGARSDDKLAKADLSGIPTVATEGLRPAVTEGDEGASDDQCTYTDPHPIGMSIADTYQVSYEQVMSWFCSGYSFDNILIALETSDAVDVPPDVLLDRLLETDWEDIWEEVGLTGMP
jgi:hypothetical protein